MSNILSTGFKIGLLTVALILIYLFRYLVIQPPAIDPNHAFDTQQAFERLERILGDERPHPVDSAVNDDVIARLKTEISALGFTPFSQDEFHCVSWQRSARCARLQNIMFWVTEPGPNAVLVLSHHDSVPAGPGASDDGAGVTASLQIASILKTKELNRPVLVLITDGEELGLMGANLFVEKNPLVEMVGAVVNMEARGVGGLSTFFQTSRPNERDLHALHHDTRLPAASSLNADIYDLLPNDTDLTEFLGLPLDAANLAYTGDVAFYHTPGDSLANMDKRALFHLGASGLAAVEGFLTQTENKPERQLLYVDVLGVYLLSMSMATGLVLLLISFVIIFALFWSQRAATPLLRAFVLPPVVLMLAIGFSIGATMIVAMIRPETAFASAHPIALRGLHASVALFGAMIGYMLLGPRQSSKSMLMSSWLWMGILGLAMFFLVPGGAILFIPALFWFGLGGAIMLFKKDVNPIPFSALGILSFAVLAVPLSALGETSLIIENAAPFVFAPVLLLVLLMPLLIAPAGTERESFKFGALISLVLSVGFLGASLIVPAYSEHAPRSLTITHIQSANFENASWSVFGSDRVPQSMQAVAPFTEGSLPVFGGPRQLATAPHLTSNLQASFTRDTQTENSRSLALEVNAPQGDRLAVSLDVGGALTGLKVNGFEFEAPDSIVNIICSGRACKSTQVEFAFSPSETPLLVDIVSTRFGLGPAGQRLIEARPDWAISRQNGDSRITHVRFSRDAENAPSD